MRRWPLPTACALLLVAARMILPAPPDAPRPPFPFIDAHVHVYEPTAAFYDFLERWNVRMLNVAVSDTLGHEMGDPAWQHARERQVFRRSRGRVAWASTFDATPFESAGFAERTAAALDSTFADGAVGVKIWKNIGLQIKSRDGSYLMADNPVFGPIFNAIAARDKTLIAHLAEPITSWLPLEKQKPSHALYYGSHPDSHMYKHPGVPSKESILAARDRMLEQNPKLRVVGCHLGSMEEDVADAARRLDRYPNFALDTAARMPDLMGQPREKVREFLLRYQDRILYGTDIVWSARTKEADAMRELQETYVRDWRYLATSEVVEYPLDKIKVRGLALPMPVLRKIYYENAVRWVPGVAPPVR